MDKNKLIKYHLAGWAIYFIYELLGIFVFPSTAKEHQFPFYIAVLRLSFTLSLISVFYYCYAFVLPGLLSKKRMVLYIPGIVLAPLVFTATRYLIEETLYPVIFGFRNYGVGTTIKYYVFDNLYYSFPAIAVSAIAWGLQRAYRQEKENKQLREEKIQAELAFLKSQVNPHFLYNTLNYIYSLAYPVSDKLANAIIKLSQLMRHMLHESADGKVELQKEIDYLDSYIAIYRLRFEDQFFVEFTNNVPDTSQRIASLVMIPFVENALKHGVVNDPAHPVKIELNVTGKLLTFVVSNQINQSQKDHSGGVGLNNIRRRLELIYSGKHELTILADAQTYQTTLTVNL
jgi:two-component system LytT family sensor kinase